MPGLWTPCQRLGLCGLIGMPALFPERKTVEELARWTPGALPVWPVRRVLMAAYGASQGLAVWWGEAALQPVPPAKDGPRSHVGDGRGNPQRGTNNPRAHTGCHR